MFAKVEVVRQVVGIHYLIMLLPTRYKQLNSTNQPFAKCVLCSVRRAQFKASSQASVGAVLKCTRMKKIRKIAIRNGTLTNELVHDEETSCGIDHS